MNRRFVRTVLFPLHERLRGRRTLAFLRDFRRNDRLSGEALESLRDAALRRLIRHAATQVPRWRRHFSEGGGDPGSFRGAADLARLPTMDKVFIRAELESLVADSMRGRVFKLATGGSSGEPLVFFTDKDRESSQLAAKLRAREWFGIHPGDRQLDLWGSPIELGANDRFREWKDRLLNFRMLSAFRLSDAAMAGFRAAIVAHHTDFLYGYASVLARYAAFLEGRGESLRDLHFKGAITTAELLVPEDAATIARVFGCPVINEYGCRDGGWIAQTCPKGRLHVAIDCVHVEILDDDGKPLPAGQVGEICVTNLWSYGMPILRYRLGDRGALAQEACECGRPHPVLEELQGRQADTLVTPEGNRVHGLGVMYVIRPLPGVAGYQVEQDRVDHVDVRIVLGPGADRAGIESAVREGLHRVLSPAMRVDVAFVEAIKALPSGKLRAVISRVERAPHGSGGIEGVDPH